MLGPSRFGSRAFRSSPMAIAEGVYLESSGLRSAQYAAARIRKPQRHFLRLSDLMLGPRAQKHV